MNTDISCGSEDYHTLNKFSTFYKMSSKIMSTYHELDFISSNIVYSFIIIGPHQATRCLPICAECERSDLLLHAHSFFKVFGFCSMQGFYKWIAMDLIRHCFQDGDIGNADK